MTLVVSGSASVQLFIPRGQILDHNGQRTVWTGTMTDIEERDVVKVIHTLGLEVSAHIVDPDDGSDERTDLHIAPVGEVGRMPTIACPTCAWLDYGPDGFRCGADTWHPVVARAFDHGKASVDIAACPAGHLLNIDK